jgi:hypothetical protein
MFNKGVKEGTQRRERGRGGGRERDRETSMQLGPGWLGGTPGPGLLPLWVPLWLPTYSEFPDQTVRARAARAHKTSAFLCDIKVSIPQRTLPCKVSKHEAAPFLCREVLVSH